jgi:lipopolysaccharide biosynthesis regulator YciM
MGAGYMLDYTRVGEWIEGEPEHALFQMLKLKGRRRLPATTYRCERCGYLESYALDV